MNSHFIFAFYFCLFFTIRSQSFTAIPKTVTTNQHRFIKNYSSQKRNYILFHSNPKNLLKSMKRNNQQRKVEDRGLQGSQANLNSIIQSAISSSGSNATIVIINKTPVLTPDMSTLLGPTQPPTLNCSNSGPNGNSTNGVLTFDKIQGLVDIANAIGKVYDGYYKIFPNQNTFINQTANTDVFSKPAAILSFYGKVRTFIVAVLKEKDQLENDMNTIQTSVNGLQTTQMDMLRFLGLDDRYKIVKMKTAPFESYDPKFNAYYMDMVDMTMTFNVNVKSVMNMMKDLNGYVNMFMGAVKELMNIGVDQYDSKLMNVLDKIDTVLMFLGSLLQLKLKLEASLDGFKKSLTALSANRSNLSTSLDKLSNLADYYQMQTNKNTSILRINHSPIMKAMTAICVSVLMTLR